MKKILISGILILNSLLAFGQGFPADSLMNESSGKNNFISLNLGSLFSAGRFGNYPGPGDFGGKSGGLSASVTTGYYFSKGLGIAASIGYYQFFWKLRVPKNEDYPITLSGQSEEWRAFYFGAGLSCNVTVGNALQLKPYILGTVAFLNKEEYIAAWEERRYIIHTYYMEPRKDGFYPGLNIGFTTVIKNPGNFFFAVSPEYKLLFNSQETFYIYDVYNSEDDVLLSRDSGKYSEFSPLSFFSLQAGIGMLF